MKKHISLVMVVILACISVSLCGCPPTNQIPDQVTEGPKPTAEPEVGEVPIQPMK